MRLRTTFASAAAVAAIAGGAVALAAVPASADTTRGTTGCFAYSYDDDGGGVVHASATVYWHNRCAGTHRIKIKASHASDGCFTASGDKKDHHKFKSWDGFQVKITSVKQVASC